MPRPSVRIPLLVFLVVFLLAGSHFPGRASAATRLALPDTLPPVPAEIAELEAQCRQNARIQDRPAALALTLRLLNDFGDRDWALEMAARSLVTAHGILEAQAICENRDLESLGAADPGGEAWDLMTAVILQRRGRAATAQGILDGLTRRRPEWAIPHAYLFLVTGDLMRPISERQEHLDRCLGDGTAMDIVIQRLEWIFDKNPDHPDADRLAALLDASPETSLRRVVATGPELRRALIAAEGDGPAMLGVWRDYLDRHGDAGWYQATEAAYLMATRLPPRIALETLPAAAVEDPRGDPFRLRTAEAARILDREQSAWDILEPCNEENISVLLLKTQLAEMLVEGPRALSMVEHLFDLTVWHYVISALHQGLATAGRMDDWLGYWEEVCIENPEAAIRFRLFNYSPEQVGVATALVDSLETLDLYGNPFKREIRYIRSFADDIPALQEILAEEDSQERRDGLWDGMRTAESKGNSEAVLTFAKAYLENAQGNPKRLASLMTIAFRMGDKELAEQAYHILAGEFPADPFTRRQEIRLAAYLDQKAKARELTAAVDPDDPAWHEPSHLTDLVNLAEVGGLEELEDRASELGMELFPHSGPVRMTRAEVLKRQGDHAAAGSIFRDLAAEYPGSTTIASALVELGQSVVSLEDTPESPWDTIEVFAPFEHDLENLEWVRGLRMTDAAADSVQDDAVMLYEADSIVLQGLKTSHHRSRRVIQITSEIGAELHRTKVITFYPEDGIPRIRVARVFTPDGAVHDINRKDILIRAAEGDNTDVSDAREMVITFGNLVPGALIDIVTDEVNEASLTFGWSYTYRFAGAIPTRKSVFEVLIPPELSILTSVHGDEVMEVETGLPNMHRWQCVDLMPLEEEDWAPDWSQRVPWVGLTTFGSWEDVAKAYAEPYWAGFSPDDSVRSLARDLTAGLDDDRDKADALYRFVVEEINGLAVELGSGRLLPSPPADVLRRKWGDCKDTSTLLIALLEAVGISAQPVLVSTWDNMEPRQDLPTLKAFNHMIVRISGLPGEPYCDPLNGTNCLAPLPSASTGRLALHLGRDGDYELSRMPPSRSGDHGFSLEVDVTPLDARRLRWDLAAEYYGEPAEYMSTLLSFADTSFQKSALDNSVGYGVRGEVEMRDWAFTESECGRVSARLSYVDTTWASEGATEASLRHITEASNYWGLPDNEDRLDPVVFRSPYEARVVLRLHGTSAWTPSDRIASFETEGPKHRGRIKVDSRKEEDGRLVTVAVEFNLEDRFLTREEYEEFHKEALSFFMHAAQVYRFRHPLDGDRVKMIDQYVKEFPEDMGFRLKAAMDLLGNNFGGYGEDGKERRRLARTLLEPLVDAEEPGVMAAVIASTVESMDGQYRKADEIIDRARRANPNDLQLVRVSMGIKNNLDELDEVVKLCERMVNETGNPEAIKALILTHMVLGNEDEVGRQLKRTEMMGAPLDSLDIMLLRFASAEKTENRETLETALAFARRTVSDEFFIKVLESSMFMAVEDFGTAADRFEDLVSENPIESTFCNNLAWCLALAGRDLERARMLSEAASIMSDDPSSSMNTYAVVLARMGEWKKARDLLRDLYEQDDRPENVSVNGYFLGLAEWKLGHEDEAEEIWKELQEFPVTITAAPWIRKLQESRRLIAEGKDPTGAVFSVNQVDE